MTERALSNVLNALYLAVLVLAAAVFYAVATGLMISLIGAAYFLCAGFTVRGKMVEVLVIAGFLAYLVVRGYLHKPSPKPLGMKAKPERFPRLFAVLDEVASNVGTRRPDEVFVSPGAAVTVSETAGLSGLFGRSHRVLELGVASLYALNMDELKAILAHEFAHYTSREAFFRRFIARVLTALQSAVGQLRTGRFWWISPFYHALHAYEFLFRYFATTFSRQREYHADRLASRCYGGNVLASGLVNFACASALFEGPAYGGLFRLFEDASPQDGQLDVCCFHGRRLPDLMRYAWAACRDALPGLADVAYFRGKRITLESDEDVPVQIDGDPGGNLPVILTVLPKALSMCVPA